MNPKRYEKVSLLLAEFLELETSEWQKCLEDAEAVDPGIGKDVARMLEAYRSASGFLEESVDVSSLAEEFLSLFDPDDRHDLVGTALEEIYDVERVIGQGGMGVVYLARHRNLPKEVAIKVVSEDLKSRVKLEGEAGVKIKHPAVVAVTDLRMLPSGDFYLVMDYVDGHSLRDEMKRHRRMRIDETVEIVSQVASALDAAHRAGFVHRDIKPQNILLADGVDTRSRVRVIDFGIAGHAPLMEDSADVTRTGIGSGTPAYMSPEQWSGRFAVDQRTDVYSLGVVTFEMLAGCRPCQGTIEQIRDCVVRGDHARLEAFAPEVPAPFRLAIERALALVPNDRFPTAGAFAASLRGETAGDEEPPVLRKIQFEGLSPIDRIDVAGGRRSVEFYQGDLLAMPRDWNVDVLVVSAGRNSYHPTHGTLIRALLQRGIVVSDLAKRKAIDLREFSSCWLSQELAGVVDSPPARRILLFETTGVATPASRIDDLFRSLVPVIGHNESPATVAMSLVGTGGRRGTLRNLVDPLVRSAVRWLESDLVNVGRLVVVERSEEKGRELRELLRSRNERPSEGSEARERRRSIR